MKSTFSSPGISLVQIAVAACFACPFSVSAFAQGAAAAHPRASSAAAIKPQKPAAPLKYAGNGLVAWNYAHCGAEAALMAACSNSSLAQINFAISHGASPNVSTSEEMHPLIFASLNGNISVVKHLVALGAHVNAVANGQTALDYAEEEGTSEAVKYLKATGRKRVTRSCGGRGLTGRSRVDRERRDEQRKS